MAKERRALSFGGAQPITSAGERSAEVESRELATIAPRDATPTRGVDPGHVVSLALSIHALGLLEPIVVDQHSNLLAGGHRLAACRVLAASDDERGAVMARCIEELSPPGWEPSDGWVETLPTIPSGSGALKPLGVPVRVVVIDAGDADAALHIEVAENEQRKDYSRAEVRALWQRLEQSDGYRTEPGRPKNGEISATDVIATVIGKSRRTVQRMISAANDDAGKTPPIDAVSKEIKARTSLRRAAIKYLQSGSADEELRTAAEIVVQMIETRR